MANSLFFIPDISGFTNFVQTTEVEHSQKVIAELLEVLIDANELDLQLAEVEGDALFFYGEIPTAKKLLKQLETMFSAFHNHLQVLENNRICPHKACALAPELKLKIIVHCGELNFINVNKTKKPFGKQVIEAHRLLKNSIVGNNYVLLSSKLAKEIALKHKKPHKLFNFEKKEDDYDGASLSYLYAHVNNDQLRTKNQNVHTTLNNNKKPDLRVTQKFNVPVDVLLELITNYKYRKHWLSGVDDFEYNEHEVTRLGSQHTCIIGGKHLNFTAVTKTCADNELVYGELTRNVILFTKLYRFYTLKALNTKETLLTSEMYWSTRYGFQRVVANLFIKNKLKKDLRNSMKQLSVFARKKAKKLKLH